MQYLGEIKEEPWIVDETMVIIIVVANCHQWLLDCRRISYPNEVQQSLYIFGYKYDETVLKPINTYCDQ